MFGARIFNSIKETMPELQGLQILVGGYGLNIGNYELLNALLIQNNVLDETKKSIAIFHPKSDLLDIYILIIMGIAAYKDSVLRNSRLKINDFKPGELVAYGGKIVRFGGIQIDPTDHTEKFQIIYGEQAIKRPNGTIVGYSSPSTFAPLTYFSDVSKYHGSKTSPDLEGAKKDEKKNIVHTLQRLLGFQEKHGLSGYPTFLISSERSRLIELLKETTINGTPFFDIFPSVKCTSENRYRLGRDSQQRSYMFYFVSNLSTADDILRAEPTIRTLFVDARGKAFNNGSLLASIRNQYNFEDLYWLQTYERLETVEQLENGLDFKIWIWDKRDYTTLTHDEELPPKTGTATDNYFETAVSEHNITPFRLAKYVDIPIEVSYPPSMTIDIHGQLQRQIREMFLLSADYGNADLLSFSIHSAGLVNRIFQSPLSAVESDAVASRIGRKTFDEDIRSLKDRITILANGPLPEGFREKAFELLANLEISIKAFKEYYGKINQVLSIINENQNKKICILTNPKYASMSDSINKIILSELGKIDKSALISNLSITNNITQAVNGNDIIIWTFKPPTRSFLMLEPGVEKNYLLLYPLQKKEFELSLRINSRNFQRYLTADYRAEILKLPKEMLQKEQDISVQPIIENEVFDLEKLLSSTMAKTLSTNNYNGRSEIVNAKMVLFSDGTHALFQMGNKIKVLNLEQKTIDTKRVNDLSEGDQIAFLKDSKRTVFEDILEYYTHVPEIVELVKLSELWRTALIAYRNKYSFHPILIKRALDKVGLVRGVETIENWLDGTTICPDDDNYIAVDKIAEITEDSELKDNLEKVKDAARKIHALRIKIGRYMAKKITQSYVSPDSIIDDPILKNKLDEISSHVHIAQVTLINDETSRVPIDMTNKLLTEEDI